MPVNIVNNTDAIKRQDNITPIEVLLTDDNNANYPIDGKTVKAWFSNETGFLYEKELTERDGQKLIIRIDQDEVDKIGIGKIKMEIVVEESDRQKIFPNGSYIEFEIVRNLKSINGTVLNPITLEFFEQEFADLKLVADSATQRANDAADRVEALEPEIANMQEYATRAEQAATEAVNSNEELNQRITSIGNAVGVSVESYERLSTETDDSGRIQRAINELPDGGVLVFPHSNTYYANSVTSNGKTLNIFGYGATIIQNANATVLDFRGGWEFIQNVSAIQNVDYDFSEGNSTTTRVALVTVSDGSQFKVGDTVKIVSDDLIENTNQNSGDETKKKRKGEFAEVYRISGNSVYLAGTLSDSYTTNIRIAKMMDKKIIMKGLTFNVLDDGMQTDWKRVQVKLTAFKYADIEISTKKSYDSFVLATGLFNYRAKISAENCLNEPGNGRYGYGFNDASCDTGLVYASDFSYCRHGYTTSTGFIVAGSDAIESYGKTRDITIDDSDGFSCSNSPFDVHEEAESVTFVNCRANGNVAGPVGSGAGFQARAKNITFDNCKVKNSRIGFYAFEQYAGTTENIRIVNCQTDNVERSLEIKGNSGSGIRVRKVTIDGGKLSSYGSIGNRIENAEVIPLNNPEFIVRGYQGFALLDNATIKGDSIILTVISSSSSYRGFDLTGVNSVLDIDKIKINLAGTTATDGKLFRLSNTTASVLSDYVNVITSGVSITNVFDSLGAGTGTLKVGKIKVDQDVLVLSDTNFSTLIYSFETPTKTSAARFQDLNSDNAAPIINGINDDMFIRIRPMNSNKVLGVFPKGVRMGQRLIVRNSGTSYSTTVKHGSAYNVNIGSDITLSPDGILPLFWDGSFWTKAV